MKRLLLMMAAVASVTAAIPLAAPAFARDDQRGRAERQERPRGGGRFENDRGGGRSFERTRPPERAERRGDDRARPRDDDDRRARVPALGYGDRRRDDDDRRRHEPRPRYEARDDDRPRYDERRGGPRAQGFAPPSAARRGGYLPRNFNGEIVDDYRRYRLRTPPAGFVWVRMGRGFAMVSMRDGQIFDMVQ